MTPKRALLIAFHFPPVKASSGLERSLALVRHLPKHGWTPLVLTASPQAYPVTSSERLSQVPDDTVIERCFARDASKLFSIGGRYPAWVGLPDKWQTWMLGAVPRGLAMIRRHRPDVIWSTYPIATAHEIGWVLHKLSGLPWVADFRDPMVEYIERDDSWSPQWDALRRARLRIESRVAKNADALTFCTEGAMQICAERYPQADRRHWKVVPNGFDESAFRPVAGEAIRARRTDDDWLMLHSGTIYPTPDRDPSHFFRALRRVIDARGPRARRIRVRMRAAAVGHHYDSLIAELGLGDHVEFAPAIAYREALQEMVQADAVLLLQGYTSNPAIPAKLYEYFRAGRPLFALADEQGDTLRLIRAESAGWVAPLDDELRIAEELVAFIAHVEGGHWRAMRSERVALYERAHSAARFSAIFDAVLGLS